MAESLFGKTVKDKIWQRRRRILVVLRLLAYMCSLGIEWVVFGPCLAAVVHWTRADTQICCCEVSFGVHKPHFNAVLEFIINLGKYQSQVRRGPNAMSKTHRCQCSMQAFFDVQASALST